MNMQISTFFKPCDYVAGVNPKTTVAALAVSFCFFFSGCASFSDKMISRHKIDLLKEDLPQLSGIYQLKPDLEYNKDGEAKLAQGKYLIENIHRSISQKKIDIDTSANLLLTVKVLDSNNVNFLFKNDKIVLDSVTLSTELQSTGLLYLGNHYVKAIGVPYLWGGTMSEKTRIGLASDGGLILNHVIDRSGGILLVFLGGHSSQSAYHFKRINSK
ncbi:hypothetical protein [Pedobacter jeongneungensis]|uniref:hypothetical protein n=1 Tax=Pedobacter jeongneungensis TaxID=947309 RepID=UPI00046A2CB6|nr:hypothetical protein [Pedobacter jeongneungensis]